MLRHSQFVWGSTFVNKMGALSIYIIVGVLVCVCLCVCLSVMRHPKRKLNIDEVGVKHNNAIDNVHEEEEKDSKSEHRFYFELSTFK